MQSNTFYDGRHRTSIVGVATKAPTPFWKSETAIEILVLLLLAGFVILFFVL